MFPTGFFGEPVAPAGPGGPPQFPPSVHPELNEMRLLSASWMSEWCDLEVRGYFTSTPGGGGTYTPPGMLNGVRCRVAPLGSSTEERAIAERLQDVSLLRLTVPYGTPVDGVTSVILRGRHWRVAGILEERSFAVERHLILQGEVLA